MDILLDSINKAFSDSKVVNLLDDYHVIPNSKIEENNNDNKLSRMRLDVENAGLRSVIIVLPKNATLHYTNNLWIPYGKMCRRVKLLGENSVLQCNNISNPSGNDGAIGAWAWGTADHFSPYDYKHESKGTQASFGYRVKDIRSGDNVVKLVNFNNISKFKAGNRVFLHGKNKQELGYPPNLEYHEYSIIDAIDIDSGTIILRNKLKYDYSTEWHDISPEHDKNNRWGKPRIVNLDDTERSYALDFFIVTGVKHSLSEHPDAPHQTSQYMTSQGAINCAFIDCSTEGQLGISQNNNAIIKNCTPKFIGDIDKLLGSVYISKLQTESSIEPATGAEYVHIKDSECAKHIRLCCKHFHIENVDIKNSNSFGGIILDAASTNVSGVIDNVRLYYEDEMNHIIQIPLDRKFIPDSSTPNHIFSKVSDTTSQDNVLSLIRGDIITDVNQIYWAQIKNVKYENKYERFNIEHSSSHMFNDEVVLIPSSKLKINNIQVISKKTPKYQDMLWLIPFYQHQHPGKKAVFEGILDGQKSFRASFKYVGMVSKIRLTVLKNAKVTDATEIRYELNISDRGIYYASPITNINKLFSASTNLNHVSAEVDLSNRSIEISNGWSNVVSSENALNKISRKCTFLFLDVVKPQNLGGGSPKYKNWFDCPRFKVEVWGESIIQEN